MAPSLKTFFDEKVVADLARALKAAHPPLDERAFVAEGVRGLFDLELTARARHLAGVMARHLPSDYPAASDVLLRSLGPEIASLELTGMAPFFYLPHVYFVAERGIDDLARSLALQHELTKRFTAEFSIRAFLERYPEETLSTLRRWAKDPSVHVRRLVSEGTRPRLPWAPRLRRFMKDPSEVLALLELLKDDPELYVRRSVANNLNDIGKDHPEVLVEVCRRWWEHGGKDRRWLVRHALRSLVKAGHPGALDVLGFGARAKVELADVAIRPKRVRVGGELDLAFTLRSTARTKQSLAVDLAVHYVKASGKTRPKVFKLRVVELAPGASVVLERTLSFRQMSTRTHHAGRHTVELLVNGARLPAGAFDLVAPKAPA